MRRVHVIVTELVAPGAVIALPDATDPEVGLAATLATAKAVLFACHPDDEQRVRDALALAQEHAL